MKEERKNSLANPAYLNEFLPIKREFERGDSEGVAKAMTMFPPRDYDIYMVETKSRDDTTPETTKRMNHLIKMARKYFVGKPSKFVCVHILTALYETVFGEGDRRVPNFQDLGAWNNSVKYWS